MVERIGRDSALAREALRAAQKSVGTRVPDAGVPAIEPGRTPQTAATPPIDFERALADGVERVSEKVDAADRLPADLLSGKITDFHEIAVQLKSAELSFKFAMEIRNKLIDAYREVMRMSV